MLREHPWLAPCAHVLLWWMLIGYLLAGQTHASMLRCTSNASAHVVMCGSSASPVSVVDNQSINQRTLRGRCAFISFYWLSLRSHYSDLIECLSL